MEWIIGAIVVVAIIVIAAAVIYWLAGASARAWQNVEKEEVNFFSVEPSFVCKTNACRVDIGYEVETTHDNTQVSLKVIRPSGDTVELSTELTFQVETNGGDGSFWIEGDGDYIFSLHVSGDQIGSFSKSLKTTIFSQSGTISHFARVDMSQSVDLQVARDSFALTEFRSLKIPEYTICQKSAEITAIRYTHGGLPGHDPEINLTLKDKNGHILLDLVKFNPGVQFDVDPHIVIAGGVQVDSLMVGGTSGAPPNSIPNPFSTTDTVPWDLEIDVHCI